MKWLFHSASLRYALALWLATVLAFLIAFIVQLEPAQWVGITVWIMFIQSPRLNYSKIIWWSFGTLVGAFMAVILNVCFSQTPELLLLFLALWLAVCAALATLVNSFRAYGLVLAGYTCAIVSMSAVEHPELIFRLAVTRVSCIFIGMASAVLFITLLLPKHRHWKETLHQLSEHLKSTLQQAAKALHHDPTRPPQFTWRHMVDRLSTLEHTLDVTTAETADSRMHAPQASSLVATLFNLLAKAQAVEAHLSRSDAIKPSPEICALLERGEKLLTNFAATVTAGKREPQIAHDDIESLRIEIVALRSVISGLNTSEAIAHLFLLNQLGEILAEFDLAIQDWHGLFGPWSARRASHLTANRDYLTAFIYGMRMFLAMGLVTAIWFITEWPSGSQLVLFTAVVCSLLSLVDHAPLMGLPFLKSAAFCAIMAYVECFWLQQKAEGFVLLALMLGLFLLPAAYAYRHPRLVGGAVVSMLIFYGLSNPANQMNYNIIAFLNNGLALLCATACGFFAFHAVPSLDAKARRYWLLRTMRRDLAHANIWMSSEQSWTSCMFDRLRLLHRAAGKKSGTTEWLEAENEMLVGLQLGLRQRRLHGHLITSTPEAAQMITDVLQQFCEMAHYPSIFALYLRSTCIRLEGPNHIEKTPLDVRVEIWEMTRLLETSTRFYTK